MLEKQSIWTQAAVLVKKKKTEVAEQQLTQQGWSCVSGRDFGTAVLLNMSLQLVYSKTLVENKEASREY